MLVLGGRHDPGVCTDSPVNGTSCDDTTWAGGAVGYESDPGDPSVWVLSAYLKAWEGGPSNTFGWSTAAIGAWIAVGAYRENGPNPGFNSTFIPGPYEIGAVYLYRRLAAYMWTYYGRIKPSVIPAGEAMHFGIFLSILSIGTSELRLAVGAKFDPFCDSARSSYPCTRLGGVYLYSFDGTTWSEIDFIKPATTQSGMRFGSAVSLHGAVLAVGAWGHDSGGDQTNTSCPDAGAGFVFRHKGTQYVEEALLKPPNPQSYDYFGYSIAASSNSTHDIVAVGHYEDDCCGTGWGADPFNFTSMCTNTGAVTVFIRMKSGVSWMTAGFVKCGPPPSSQGAGFGISVSLQGICFAAGAYEEDRPYSKSGEVSLIYLP